MVEQFVVFGLEKQSYAIAIENVSEITEIKEITKLPMSNDDMEGVLNLRGEIIPIINLKKALNLNYTDEGKQILVINLKGRHLGLIIDIAKEVKNIGLDCIEEVNPLIKTPNSIIQRIINDKHQIISVIDIDRFFSLEQTELELLKLEGAIKSELSS